MDELLKWLPALIAAGTGVWTVATLSAASRAAREATAVMRKAFEERFATSDKRHESHDSTHRDHDARLRAAENAITGLKVFDELQQRRKDNAP